MANNAFDPNDFEEVPDDDYEEVPMNFNAEIAKTKTPSLLRSGAQALVGGLGETSRMVDQYTGAPVRAGVSAGIKGQNPFVAGAKQFGEDPSRAPTGKDIAMQLGIPATEFDTGLTMNPWKPDENVKASPAGIVGGAAEIAMDPTTYISPPGAKAMVRGAGMGLEKLASPLARKAGQVAEERAFKAATGQSAKAFKNAGNTLEGARNVGRSLLEKDAAGKPVLGWFDKAEDIAPKAAAKREFFGEELNRVGREIDKKVPGGSISGWDLAKDIQNYADTIPDVGSGANIKKRLQEEVNKLKDMGNLTFEEAQKVKNQFKFKHQDSDALISNQDVTNQINRFVGNRMNEAAEKSGMGGEFLGIKSKYGPMKQAEVAATDRSVKNLSNRFVSPSDYGVGSTSTIGTLIAGGDPITAAATGAAGAAANKMVRERGSAFIAKSFDRISKALQNAPEKLGKYGPALERAAAEGTRSGIALHRMLLNNDPQYVRILEELERNKKDKQ